MLVTELLLSAEAVGLCGELPQSLQAAIHSSESIQTNLIDFSPSLVCVPNKTKQRSEIWYTT